MCSKRGSVEIDHVLGLIFVSLSSQQKGKDEYKLAATSDDGGKKDKKAKAKREMDDLKKEVDLVSTDTKL